jgi:cytochrome c-type biogenesis protein CcmH/NrfG
MSLDRSLFFLGCLLLLLLAFCLLWFPLRKRLPIRMMVAIGVIPVFALVLYSHWGASSELLAFFQKKKDHEMAQAYLAQQKDPKVILQQFIAMLEADPNQPEGWYLLGNIYAKQNELNKALSAYEKAHHYNPVKSRYLMAVCEVDMEIHQQLSKPYYEELVAWVKSNPNDISARYRLGFAEFARKRYRQARYQWKLVLNDLPVESEDTTQLLALIAKT